MACQPLSVNFGKEDRQAASWNSLAASRKAQNNESEASAGRRDNATLWELVRLRGWSVPQAYSGHKPAASRPALTVRTPGRLFSALDRSALLVRYSTLNCAV